MKIYRKRYIPNEIVDISGDEVVLKKDGLIVTRWLPIKPRKDISSGISYTMLDYGWKISKIYDKDDKLLYWYCDIIDYDVKIENGEEIYILIDLLVDIKVYDDGSYEVLDVDELNDAFEKGLIDFSQKEDAERKLNELLKLIKNGNFPPVEEI